MESSLYIGTVSLILTIFTFFFSKKSNQKAFILSAGIVSIIAIILGMGINLHWNNQSVIWQIPVVLQPVFNKSETLIYLPSYWLFDRLPFFSSMRALMRFGLFALLFIPTISAFGFLEILKKLTKSHLKNLFTLGILAFVLLDFYAGSYSTRLSQPEPRPVDLWLADQPTNGALVQMPFSESVDQAQIYYTIFHEKPFVGGFFNANKPLQYQRIEPVLNEFPDKRSIDLLRDLNVEYIVIDQNAYQDYADLEHSLKTMNLTKITELDGQSVYTFAEEN